MCGQIAAKSLLKWFSPECANVCVVKLCYTNVTFKTVFTRMTFREGTSVYWKFDNVHHQAYLSSESNSNQPSSPRPSVLDTLSPSLSFPGGISLPVRHSLIPDSQESDPCVRKGNAFDTHVTSEDSE